MSQEYVKKKSLEALDASGENKQEAAQLLRVWAESDTELKNLLIIPFYQSTHIISNEFNIKGR